MVEELPLTEQPARLIELLGSWRSWQARIVAPPVALRRLGGQSNLNFLAACGRDQFVIRINQHNLGADYPLERDIMQANASQSFMPELVHWSDHGMVTRFIPGPHPQLPTHEIQIAQLFMQIHSSPTSAPRGTAPIHRLTRYIDTLTEHQQTCQQALTRLTASDTATPNASDHRLCHHDLLLPNLILHNDRLVALDWEYAAVADPAFDLAMFFQTYNISGQRLAEFLAAYGRDDLQFHQRVLSYLPLATLMDRVWWLANADDETRIQALLEEIRRL